MFGLIKDPHFNFGFPNKSRVQYEYDMVKKMDWVASQLKARGCNKLLITGDLLDNSYESKWSFKHYISIRNYLKERWINKGIKVYSIVGNHDMFNGSTDIKGTVFYELENEGLVERISIENCFVDNDAGLKILGVDYYPQLKDSTDKLLEVDQIASKETNLKTGVIFHANCSPREEMGFINYTYDQLETMFPNIDLFLCDK